MRWSALFGGAFVLLSSLLGGAMCEIIWAIPELELEFCPLSPPQPCPQYHMNFVVNIGYAPYTPAGGQDTRCRAVFPTGQIIKEWQKCDGQNLQWRWEDFDVVTSGMNFWPKDTEGYAHIGLRQLSNGTKSASPGQIVDAMTAKFRFMETTQAGGKPDAIIGCAIYNPKWPVRCSMNDMIMLGFAPPEAVIMNVTSAKVQI